MAAALKGSPFSSRGARGAKMHGARSADSRDDDDAVFGAADIPLETGALPSSKAAHRVACGASKAAQTTSLAGTHRGMSAPSSAEEEKTEAPAANTRSTTTQPLPTYPPLGPTDHQGMMNRIGDIMGNPEELDMEAMAKRMDEHMTRYGTKQ